MSNTTPAGRLRDAYAATQPARDEERAQRRRQRLAADYRPSPFLDGVLALKERDPANYDRLSISTRMDAAGYAESKQAHEEVNQQ